MNDGHYKTAVRGIQRKCFAKTAIRGFQLVSLPREENTFLNHFISSPVM